MGANFKADNIRLFPVDLIIVPEGRQRTAIKDTDEMALSIQKHGLYHPIVVTLDDKGRPVLVAGERRLRGYELLNIQKVPGFEQIPCHIFENLSPAEAQLIELEENIKRHDLDWKDHALAMRRIIALYHQVYPDWPNTKICEHIGTDYSWVIKVLKVAQALVDQHPQVQQASGIRAASAVLERETERKKTAALDKLHEDMVGDIVNPEPEQKAPVKLEGGMLVPAKPALIQSNASIMQGNFELWSDEYSGPKFNFIHCDFPYGIDHQDSDQGGAATWGAYQDDEKTYWRLIGTMLRNRERLMLRSCHIMFWYSMKFHDETKRFFNQHAPEFDIQDFPLIWHKTDNKGIMPDVKRQPRRVYETALILSRGDRQIHQVVSNCIGAPTNKADAIHVSEKPLPVLNHFFRMFVDSTTRVLDPTCGSGTSIRAADAANAEMALGLELDELYAEAAQKRLKSAQGLAALSKKAGEKNEG